jgi:hypothetical protein
LILHHFFNLFLVSFGIVWKYLTLTGTIWAQSSLKFEKNPVAGKSAGRGPNLPNCPLASQKIKVDNKARFRYQVGYWFRLIDASICGASAEADTQFAIFAWLTIKKQCLIFFSWRLGVFAREMMSAPVRVHLSGIMCCGWRVADCSYANHDGRRWDHGGVTLADVGFQRQVG